MLNNATGFERIYIACGLSPSYFYPHLLEKSLYINAFFQKDEDNILRCEIMKPANQEVVSWINIKIM